MLLKTDPLARTSSLPPTGGRGVGTAPSLTGRGGGWVGFFAAEAVSQFPGPPLEDPPTSPPRDSTGAQLGGARWDDWRTGCHRVRAAQRRGRRASLPGAAVAAKATANPRAPATLRPTCHQAKRLARRSSRCEHINAFSGPASGVAGDRGDDLAGVQRTKRSGVSGTLVSSSSGRRSRAA